DVASCASRDLRGEVVHCVDATARMVRRNARAVRCESVTSPLRRARVTKTSPLSRCEGVTPMRAMRVGALRSVSVYPESRAATVAARRKPGTRATVGIAAGCVAFLAAYIVLHVLAAGGYRPRAVTAIATIPLFARFIACAVFAAAVGGAG